MNTTTRIESLQSSLLEAARARRRRALKLRTAGHTFEEIGAALGGVSHQRARQLVEQAKRDAELERQADR